MDDLLGEDWQKPSKPTASAPPLNPATFASNYNGFRASPQPPQSGKSSPLPPSFSRPSSAVNGGPKVASKPATPSGDAFGSLTSLRSQKAPSNLSIQERQKQILEEKRRQQDQQAQLWDTLGSGRGTPEITGPSPAVPQSQGEDEEDILAAFNRAAPVNKASHYPPPGSGVASGRSTPAASQPALSRPATGGFDHDDDPFGLGEVSKRNNGHVPSALMTDNDDDILGDLAKPVSERPRHEPSPGPAAPEWDENIAHGRNSAKAEPEQDKALAELMDMGFPADTAKLALEETGGDVQGAVGWLLQQAHEESKQKAKSEAQSRRRSPQGSSRSPARRQRSDQDAMPAWMRQENRSSSAARRQNNQSPAEGERDATQVASEFGTKLFKSANSIWKASQKQMAKTMQDFQQERNPSQPRWMQEAASGDSSRASSQRRPEAQVAPRRSVKAEQEVTNEAAMLDAPREAPPPRLAKQVSRERAEEMPVRGRATDVPQQRSTTQPKPQQQAPAQDKRPATKLSRQEVEEQSAQAYVSPSRRKRPTAQPQAPSEPEVDLFSPEPVKPSPAPTANGAARTVTASRRSTPAATPRPQAPPRAVPPVSSAALSSSNAHRHKGTEAFKRGDYAAAHASYTSALTPLPDTHPVTIIIFSNRALTAIKTGDAKVAVADADRALALIGPSQGIGETIDLSSSNEGQKQMRDFFSKALTRKAEAFEHMEKYSDAAAVWQQAVSAGVGGSVSLQGRDRCEKAARPKPAAAAPVRSKAPSAGKAPPAKGLGNSLQRPALSSASSATAVKALRAANAAAEKADDEKFALTDQVDAKLAAWKGGKADNLRALLQSLDTVLWEGAGWKKVGMSDLVMPNKVKIIYMKAIAKVHPDKIPLDANTEQRMVSAAVFSTLNEAWDKFKKDNGL